MKRIVPAGLLALWATAAAAQSPAPPGPPKPGPEHKRIDYFAGKWTSEAEMKPGLLGPGGKMSGTETCEWFAGGFHLVCRSEGRGAMGEFKGMSILGYNMEEKAYTYHAFDNMGMSESAQGTVAGDTWTWSSDSKMGGKQVKGRFTIKENGAATYSFKWEASVDGAPMATLMEGTAKKAP